MRKLNEVPKVQQLWIDKTFWRVLHGMRRNTNRLKCEGRCINVVRSSPFRNRRIIEPTNQRRQSPTLRVVLTREGNPTLLAGRSTARKDAVRMVVWIGRA